jgi:hypothetical protein
VVDFPVPTLRVIKDGIRMAGGFGFVDLFPTNPKRKLVLTQTPDTQQRLAAPPPAVAFFPADGGSGIPYVRLRIDDREGRVMLADVTLQSFIDAADALRPVLNTIGSLTPNGLPPANLSGSGPGLSVP